MATFAALVLAAGKGTRMKSQTPKVLHRICGKEMVGFVVDAAKSAALDPVVVVVPRDSQPFKTALGNSVLYVHQPRPLGSGHAAIQARSALDGAENVVVLLGDMPLILPETLREMVRLHNERDLYATVLTVTRGQSDGFGRVVRSADGRLAAIVEETDADEDTRAIDELNVGAYCFQAGWLWDNLPGVPPSASGEVYLTDLIALAVQEGVGVETLRTEHISETLGVNDRVQLASADAVQRDRIRERWMLDGVTMPDPSSVFIDATVQLGRDTVLHPNTHVTGESKIGRECEVGPNSIVSDSVLGDGCRIVASVVEGSVLEEKVDVGPFSHLRPGTYLEKGVHIGNFTEVKNSRLGAGTKSGHFSFIGDADVGAGVNFGAGTVTVNYDGETKHRTKIEEGAFIGCDTMLVAPITVGARAFTAAGAVVTRDVPPDSVVKGVPARVSPNKTGRPKKR